MTTIPNVQVSQVMKTSVHLVDPMLPVRKAMSIMHELGVSSLVIERRDDSDELGLLTVTDIAREVIAKGRSMDRVDVYEIMVKPVLTVPVEMDIRYAVRLLSRFSASRGLVVDHDRKLVGIVTLRDMVLAYVHMDEGGIEA
ncbi:MAG: CBS domain-containing protein [Alphaproteobacteria bacterium]|mgnify:CR=1|jgi:predicted transcriptional regulator|nr:CBS domain-containing protein [Alphaproteobacteria bacterium]